MATLIKNALLIDPSQKLDGPADLLVVDGKVAAVGVETAKHAQAKKADVVDGSGLWLIPGLVDVHVHLREPGNEGKETIATGTRAAAAGGVTSVVAMPNTNPPVDNQALVELVKAKARSEGVVNVFPSACISKGRAGEELAELGELSRAGAVAVTDDGSPVMNTELMRRAMEYASMFGLPIIQHCEDLHLSNEGVMNEGFAATRLGLRGYPKAAESVMVARDLILAELTGAHLHLAHLSSAKSIELVRQAKKRRVPVTCETAPHYFTLTDDWLRTHPYHTHGKMNPPLGDEMDRLAVITGLHDGTIDCIATDHAPHSSLDKNVEFNLAAFGIIGLETSLALTLDQLVHPGFVTASQAVERLAWGPAKAFGLKGKGSLALGSDADLALVAPEEVWTVEAGKFASKSRNTPFEGMKLKGKVKRTMVAGNWVFGN
jgi:dihydroorotase